MRFSFKIKALLLNGILLVLMGCADQFGGGIFESECALPSDQTGTYLGQWPVTAVPVAFASGHFTQSEITSIVSAAETWNNFYAITRGFPLIDIGTASSPNLSSASNPSSICSVGMISGGSFTSSVVIYKRTSWPYSDNVIALTSTCRVTDTPVNRFTASKMEINYENFFVSGELLPDLQSIILHEFGHLIGLNHSCEVGGATGTPDCSSSSLNNDYFYASMFPVFFFPNGVNGEMRRYTQKNDQGRANCLYDGGL